MKTLFVQLQKAFECQEKTMTLHYGHDNGKKIFKNLERLFV